MWVVRIYIEHMVFQALIIYTSMYVGMIYHQCLKYHVHMCIFISVINTCRMQLAILYACKTFSFEMNRILTLVPDKME